jgi:hypothetical protein
MMMLPSSCGGGWNRCGAAANAKGGREFSVCARALFRPGASPSNEDAYVDVDRNTRSGSVEGRRYAYGFA